MVTCMRNNKGYLEILKLRLIDKKNTFICVGILKTIKQKLSVNAVSMKKKGKLRKLHFVI